MLTHKEVDFQVIKIRTKITRKLKETNKRLLKIENKYSDEKKNCRTNVGG